jgi:AraC family transcriptional activator of pobA
MNHSFITEDQSLILSRYKNAFNRFAGEGVIDIDKRLNYKYDFVIYRLEEAVSAFKGIVPALRQTPYWIVLVKEGQGQKNIGNFSFPIRNNTLFAIPGRAIHSSTYHSTKCSGYVLLFDLAFFLKAGLPKHCVLNRKVFKNSTQPYVNLDEAQIGPLESIFEKMLAEQQIMDHERTEIMAVKILELLISCDQLFSKTGLIGSNGIYHPVVEKFTALLELNFSHTRTVGQYAQLLNIHPNHLNFLNICCPAHLS